MRELLLGLLSVLGAVFVLVWARTLGKADAPSRAVPSPFQLSVGFVTDFLDTLGIGSFATTTTAFRLASRVDDRLVPGTLNVGHGLPTIVQAFVYVTLVRVDMTTLVVMIAAAVAGAWIGSGIVALWPRRAVRLGMGIALLAAVALMVLGSLGAFPAGGELLGLRGPRLAVGAVGNFVLGALMTLGVGLYAPCMILVSLLGMNPKAAFPVMMGSCAFLMPAAGFQFLGKRAYDVRAAIGLAAGGVPGVLVAAFVVRSLSLAAVRWLVVGVASYAAVTLLVDAFRERGAST